jgi:hypothetical protein
MQKQALGRVTDFVRLGAGLKVCSDCDGLLCVFWFDLDVTGLIWTRRDGSVLDGLRRDGLGRNETGRLRFAVSDNSVWSVRWDESVLVFNDTELVI